VAEDRVARVRGRVALPLGNRALQLPHWLQEAYGLRLHVLNPLVDCADRVGGTVEGCRACARDLRPVLPIRPGSPRRRRRRPRWGRPGCGRSPTEFELETELRKCNAPEEALESRPGRCGGGRDEPPA